MNTSSFWVLNTQAWNKHTNSIHKDTCTRPQTSTIHFLLSLIQVHHFITWSSHEECNMIQTSKPYYYLQNVAIGPTAIEATLSKFPEIYSDQKQNSFHIYTSNLIFSDHSFSHMQRNPRNVPPGTIMIMRFYDRPHDRQLTIMLLLW